MRLFLWDEKGLEKRGDCLVTGAVDFRFFLRPYFLRALLLLATLGAILGAKFNLIDRFGSDLPYWDQWDGEGEAIYRPYLQGTLKAADFFRPHNEHRIVPTLLLGLGLFELNDRQWDGRLQMTVNAFLHAGAALLLIGWAWRWFSLRWVALLAGVVVVFFSTSVSWENTLSGFQSQFYFLLLFSLLHLAASLFAAPGTWRWYLAPLLGLLAIFSMASGLLSAMAVLAVTVIRCGRDRTLTAQDRFVLGTNGVLAVIGFWLRTRVASTESLLASSFGQWFEAWLHQLAWPIVVLDFPWFFWLGAVPPIGFLAAFWFRWSKGNAAFFLLGVSAWLTAQTMAIAYARGAVGFGYSPRYADILNFSLLVNLVLLGLLALQQSNRIVRVGGFGFIAGLVGIGLVGLKIETDRANRVFVFDLPTTNAARLASVHLWLTTHDPRFFARTPWTELPFPEPHSLSKMLDHPLLQAALPPSARPPPTFAPKAGGGSGFAAQIKTDLANPSPYELKAWAAPAGSAAEFRSIEFKTTHQFTSLYLRGENVTEPVAIKLIGRNRQVLEPLGGAPKLSSRWKRLNFETEPGLYQLEIEKPAAGSLGFTQPFNDTRFSRLIPRLLSAGSGLQGAGIAGLVAVFVLSFFLSGASEAERSGPEMKGERMPQG